MINANALDAIGAALDKIEKDTPTKLSDLVDVSARVAALRARLEKIEAEYKLHLWRDGARTIEGAAFTATLSEDAGTRLDAVRLRVELPKVADKYTVPAPRRVVRFKARG